MCDQRAEVSSNMLLHRFTTNGAKSNFCTESMIRIPSDNLSPTLRAQYQDDHAERSNLEVASPRSPVLNLS